MNNNMGRAIPIILAVVLVGALGYITFIKKSAPPQPPIAQLPSTCVDEQEGVPVITSMSAYVGSVGTTLEINGCNFSGFEGDKDVWIENEQGVKGIMQGLRESPPNSKLTKVTLQSPLCQENNSYSGLPCTAWLTLTPGSYKIYAMSWGKKSNEVTFTVH